VVQTTKMITLITKTVLETIMKIVINKCYGGFGLSQEGVEFIGLEWDGYGHYSDLPRNDPRLVACVEQLGEKANGKYASLKVVEIPDDIKYTIADYDGIEHVAEVHGTWG